MNLHAVLLFLHVLSTAAWLGAALWITGDVKRTLGLGRPHVDALPSRVSPALGLDAIAGIATVVTGLLLMWEEGMGHPPAGISAGIVFTLGRIGVLAGLRAAWRNVLERLRAGEPVTPKDRAARRMSMLAGIAHALWLLALAGMVA